MDKLKQVVLERTYLPTETLGNLFIDGKLVCHTMELPYLDGGNHINQNCIPETKDVGVPYIVKKELPTSHFPYPHFRLQNVPKRIGICIHRGNYVSQLLGCIAPGMDIVDLNKDDGMMDVAKSTVALQMIYDMLPETFELIIRKK